MSLDTRLASGINTFPASPQGIAPPNIMDVLLLLHSLQDRVSALDDRVVSLEEENATLRLKLASLETLQEEEITRVCVDIATDRRRLAALEHPKRSRERLRPAGRKRLKNTSYRGRIIKPHLRP